MLDVWLEEDEVGLRQYPLCNWLQSERWCVTCICISFVTFIVKVKFIVKHN